MEHRQLGGSGLRVSSISLGCMAFGRWIGEKESERVFDAAFDAGVTLYDTADVYGKGMDNRNPLDSGESETILGNLMKGRRTSILLATKVNGRTGTGVNDAGLSRYHIMRAVEASLQRLKTDYIDLYQVHRFDPLTPLEETLGALHDVVAQGKARYIGCSNYAAWQIAKSHGISALNRWHRFVSVQPPYSLLSRDIEQELLPFCESEGVSAIVYSPLARGMLAGKYKPGVAAESGTRAAAGDRALIRLMDNPDNFRIVGELSAYAAEQGISLQQLALGWVLRRSSVAAAIVGASKPEHIVQAVEAADTRLTGEQLGTVESIVLQGTGGAVQTAPGAW